MASDLELKAKEAFKDDNYELAYDLFTQAIALNPNNAEIYADRAQVNIKVNNLTEAFADANKAIELNSSHSKAYLRKGNAYIKFGEYQTAKAALEMGASLAPGDSKFVDLIKECNELIAEESGVIPIQEKTTTQGAATKVVQSENDLLEPPTVTVARPKYRHEFYQKPDQVVTTIFAKGIPRDSITVDFGEQTLSVCINIPDEDAYVFQPRLFGKIIPTSCRYEVLSTKIEIHLAKAEPIQWTSLEFNWDSTVQQRVNVLPVAGGEKPTYPSSNLKRIDWDKLEAQVKKEEKDEMLDGEAGLTTIFREIYKDADEDTRRAMSKSYVESNGTVLSTDWKEVGSKRIEESVPKGMELKKWEF